MKYQSIITVPVGTDMDEMPDNLRRIIVLRLGTEFQADTYKLIGTREFENRFAVYTFTEALPDELDFLCLLMRNSGFDWQFVAGQSSQKTKEAINAEGNKTLEVDVYKPVPASFLDYIEDIVEYDEEGLELNRTRPTEIPQLHTHLGSEPWVIEQ